MIGSLSAAEVLLRAVARSKELHGQTLVVKLGGSAMEDPVATRGTLESVVALQTLGVRLVLVHGGGKPIDRAMAVAGLEPRKVAGRRYTDDATLKIVVDVLHELGRGIVEQIQALGGHAAQISSALFGEVISLPGPDGPIDLGRVGSVTEVQLDVSSSSIPVIPSLARHRDGGWLNVNADTAASAVAGVLKSPACVFLTDTPGVLRNVREPDSLMPRLSAFDCRQRIADGTIAGGMIPKVEACFDALEAGAGRAVILDGRHPHSIVRWFLGEPVGTEIAS